VDACVEAGETTGYERPNSVGARTSVFDNIVRFAVISETISLN